MVDDKQAQNLEKGKPHRWKKGESGNKAGRPKNVKYVSELLRENLDTIPATLDGKPNVRKLSWADAVVESVFEAIRRGSHPGFLSILLDRLEGRVQEKLAITGEDGGPVAVAVTAKLLALLNDGAKRLAVEAEVIESSPPIELSPDALEPKSSPVEGESKAKPMPDDLKAFLFGESGND